MNRVIPRGGKTPQRGVIPRRPQSLATHHKIAFVEPTPLAYESWRRQEEKAEAGTRMAWSVRKGSAGSRADRTYMALYVRVDKRRLPFSVSKINNVSVIFSHLDREITILLENHFGNKSTCTGFLIVAFSQSHESLLSVMTSRQLFRD
jgi:hypothetical protein